MTHALNLEPADLPPDAIEVGRIADAWGVKGWFKVLSHNADPQALLAARNWFLQPSERGARIFVPRSDFPQTQADEYYWVDLIGLDVVNREGVALGQVRELLSTGPQTVLVIAYEQDGKPHERMVPFVSAYVDKVELPERRITVDWQPDY